MTFFITFEGIEGSGKSTQILTLHQRLEQSGHPTLLTREPGGTPIGDKIRNIVLDAAHKKMLPLCELLLYSASRAQHCAEIIAPALHAKKIVLCDRFIDATIAYQEGGRQLPKAWIKILNDFSSQGIKPDLTLLFDCPVEVGLSRAKKREEVSASTQDRFEQETIDFHQRVRNRYLKIAQEEPERVFIIDATLSPSLIEKTVWNLIEKRLQRSL